MIIHLAGNREIIADAKTPLNVTLSAIEAPDEETRNNKLKDHARQIRNHVQILGGKKYFDHFPDSLDFVVLFIPGEAFYTAALQQNPELIEIAADQHVFITSPSSLIAFLKAVDNGWQQEKLADNAQQIKKPRTRIIRSCEQGRGTFRRSERALALPSRLIMTL